MEHTPDQLIQVAKNIVDFADVMILIFAAISSRMDVFALMHSHKSLYSLGIPRLLMGFTIEICNTFRLASFCEFMHGFLSENKFFYLRQISILISVSFAFSSKLSNIIRDFHRILENAAFLETLFFGELEGWMIFDPNLHGVLLSLTKLTSLHLYNAGNKSFGIINHHSSNLRSLRLGGYTVSRDVQSETFTKLSLNLRQLHISRLPNLDEIRFLRVESLILDTSPRIQLPLLIKSFPNISSLTYNSSYIEGMFSDHYHPPISTESHSHKQLAFTRLLHLRGHPKALFHLGVDNHIIHLEVTSVNNCLSELLTVFVKTRPSRLSMEMSTDDFHRSYSLLIRGLSDPSSPRLTHIALTFDLKVLSAESVLSPTIEPMVNLVQQLPFLQFISICFRRLEGSYGRVAIDSTLPRVRKEFDMPALEREIADAGMVLKFIHLDIQDLGQNLWEVERIGAVKLVPLDPKFAARLLNEYRD